MKARIIFTVASGLILAGLTYAEWKQGLAPDDVGGSGHALALGLFFLAAVISVGFIVGRWWVVLALIGPFFALVYLQVVGDYARGSDGIGPLSLPPLVGELWLALFLLLGVGLRRLWVAYASRPGGFGSRLSD